MDRKKRSRSISFEIVLWVSLLVFLPLIIIRLYFFSVMTSDLKQLEKEQAYVKVKASQEMFTSLGESMLGTTITNGLLENNRQALLHKDIDWLKKNIATIPDVVPNINFVAEADSQGNVIIQHGDIAELMNKVRFTAVMDHFNNAKGFTGITNTSKGLAIIAVAPIREENGISAPVGMIITGRFIDSEIVGKIRSILQSDVALLLKSGQFLSSSPALEQDRIHGYLREMNAGSGSFNSFETKEEKHASVARVTVNFNDMANQPIGLLYLESSSKASSVVASDFHKLTIDSGVMVLILLILVLYLLRRRIILPLRQFTQTMEKIASGSTLEEIPNNVMQAESEIVIAFQKIVEWNQVLEQTVDQRTVAIRNLLDNAGQGFLSIGDDLLVFDEYSIECERIFNREITKQCFPELLYPDDAEESELLHSILTEYFLEQDDHAKELILSLLPTEVILNHRHVQLDFKVIIDSHKRNAEAIMVIMTDISEKRQLENRMDEERRLLKMVVRVVTNDDDFNEFMEDYKYFYQTQIGEIMRQDAPVQAKATDIFKRIHTFKGTSGLLYLIHLVPKLHELESRLAAYLRQELNNPDDLQQLLLEFKLDCWLEEDLVLLKHILGDEFLQGKQSHMITIDPLRLAEFEQKMRMVLTAEKDKPLLLELRKWRYKPMKSLFKSYPEFVQQLAEKEGLTIHPVVIEGGDMLIDPEYFHHVAKSSIHILRNSVVHGIESEEERLEAGKDPSGLICIRIQHEGDQMCLTISDDGRGIDLRQIRAMVIDLGLCDPKQAAALTDEEALEFIFREEFSTQFDVNDLAGRGIGLSVVRSIVEQMGGVVEVETTSGKGSTFIFHIPYAGLS